MIFLNSNNELNTISRSFIHLTAKAEVSISILFLIAYIFLYINFSYFFLVNHFNIFYSLKNQSNIPLKLWFNKPSSTLPLKLDLGLLSFYKKNRDNVIWQENTIPIGNGYLGANIYSEITNEVLTFNEKTLWSGGPSKKRPNYFGGNNKTAGRNGFLVKEIQKLFKEEKNDEAKKLCFTLLGDTTKEDFGSYLNFGKIYFHFLNTNSNFSYNFERSLDLETSISYVSYDYKDKNGKFSSFKREYFASYPDNLICIKFTVEGELNFEIEASFKPSNEATTLIEGNQIKLQGELEDNQLKFNGKLVAITKDGSVEKKGNSLLITKTKEVVFFVTAATDYDITYPKYRTGETNEELNSRVQKMIQKGIEKGYSKIKEDHIIDYQKIFNRVRIDIGQRFPQMPTNELLNKYKKINKTNEYNSAFRYLESLLFYYGRYLSISSSRKGSLPSNLQGVWNDLIDDVPWLSDYHTNINLQMNYFPTFVTNMAYECGTPLLDFIESIRVPGRITAGIYTGIFSNESQHNGFMLHARLNPFGWTAPGWKFNWGWSPTAVLWILHNIFEFFLFTNDMDLLEKRIYPMIKEEAIFFEKFLIFDEKNQRLITSPTYSPEHGPPTNGNTYEQTIIWQHFTNTILAAKLLNVDKENIKKWEKILSQLKPIEIGDSGQIKEWYEETKLGSMGQRNHRHLSHLLGLYPFDLISTNTTDYLKAAIVSLNDRGDYSTGWGMGQRINAWARTGDGDRSFKLLQNLLKNGIYSNLFDTHPPFQIDGNFAATSGISEMLLQSTYNRLKILPALPKIWSKKGSFKGLVAKGNIVVSCWWSKGKAIKIILEPRYENEIEVQCKGIGGCDIYENDSGEKIEYKMISNDKIAIKVKGKKIYSISNNH